VTLSSYSPAGIEAVPVDVFVDNDQSSVVEPQTSVPSTFD
jgi:hypothetical protein